MKKVTLWLCVGMLMLGLSACGTGNGEQRKNAAAETGEGADMAGGSGAADRTGTGDSEGEDVIDRKLLTCAIRKYGLSAVFR